MRKATQTLILAAAIVVPGSLEAQQSCAQRDVVTNKLQTGYGETFTGGGLRNSTSVFEVWASEKGGTWTILMTKADGTSCIMASGTNWRGPTLAEQAVGIPG